MFAHTHPLYLCVLVLDVYSYICVLILLCPHTTYIAQPTHTYTHTHIHTHTHTHTSRFILYRSFRILWLVHRFTHTHTHHASYCIAVFVSSDLYTGLSRGIPLQHSSSLSLSLSLSLPLSPSLSIYMCIHTFMKGIPVDNVLKSLSLTLSVSRLSVYIYMFSQGYPAMCSQTSLSLSLPLSLCLSLPLSLSASLSLSLCLSASLPLSIHRYTFIQGYPAGDVLSSADM